MGHSQKERDTGTTTKEKAKPTTHLQESFPVFLAMHLLINPLPVQNLSVKL